MKTPPFHIYCASPNSLLLSFDFEKLNQKSIIYLQQVKERLVEHFNSDILYVTPAFDTLLINFKSHITARIKSKIEDLLKQITLTDEVELHCKTYEIPVCYEPFGLDLKPLSGHSGFRIEEIIKLHSKQLYTIHFIGFIPGFLYMGEVDKRIRIPRLKKPRQKVAKGSVGIAENQTGIYPSDSPGGWQIIGRTPIELFKVENNPPSIFRPGDQITFKSIDKGTFFQLKAEQKQILKPI